MTYGIDPRIDTYIEALPGWQQAVCREVRDLVHAADPHVTETIKRTNRPYFVLQGNICALLAAKDHVNVFVYDGGVVPDPDGIITQDMIAWVAQGPISDRPSEHLGAGDKGVIMYHKMLLDNVKAVERGEDPIGTIRDPAENEPCVDIRRGRDGWKSFQVSGGTFFGRQENAEPVSAR